MDDTNNSVSAKKSRARRSLIIKHVCSKRQRHTTLQQLSFNMQLTTPNTMTTRTPLSKLTPSHQNQKTVEQIVEKGRLLSAQFHGSEPIQTRHGFRTTKHAYNIHNLGKKFQSFPMPLSLNQMKIHNLLQQNHSHTSYRHNAAP